MTYYNNQNKVDSNKEIYTIKNDSSNCLINNSSNKSKNSSDINNINNNENLLIDKTTKIYKLNLLNSNNIDITNKFIINFVKNLSFSITQSDNYLIIDMLNYYFNKDSRPDVMEAKNALFYIADIINRDDIKLKCYIQNILIVIFFILMRTPIENSKVSTNKYVERFNKILEDTNSIKYNNLDDESTLVNFVISINKLEFIFKYSCLKTNNCKNLINNIRSVLASAKEYFNNKINDNINNKNDLHSINNYFYYYLGISYYIENDKDKAFNIITKNLKLNDNSYSKINKYFNKRCRILLSIIEKENRNYKEEYNYLINLQCHLNSSDLTVKICLNLSELLHKKMDVLLLYKVLNECNIFLKSKSIIGNTNSLTNYTEICIITKLRILYCCSLLENNDEYKIIMEELDEIYKSLKKSQEYEIDVKSENTKQLVYNKAYKPKNNYFSDNIILNKLLTNFQVFFLFFKCLFNYDISKNNILSNLIEKNPDVLNNFTKEIILNIYLIMPNNTYTNKHYYKIVDSSKLELNNLVDKRKDNNINTQDSVVKSIFTLYNYLQKQQISLISDTSEIKRKEYIENIREISKLLIKNSCYIDLELNYFKNMLCSIYFIYAYSYYICNNYDTALNIINSINDISIESYANETKLNELKEKLCNNINILKIKGDIYLKLKNYKEALNTYLSGLIICNSIKINRNIIKYKAIVNYNSALCYIELDDYKQAKTKLESSLEIYNSLVAKDICEVESINEITDLLKLF